MDSAPPGPRSHVFPDGVTVWLRSGDTYSLVLTLIVVGYVLMAVLEDSRWSRLLLAGTVGSILLLSLYASHTRGHLLRIAGVVTAVSVTLAIVQAVTGGGGATAAAAGYTMFMLLATAPVAIAARIARHPVVNLETILGAVCAYMLIGMLFAGLYRAADAMGAEPFFVQSADPTPVKYLYFSFVTLTTLGFGDLTPATDAGRVLVSFEALFGQVFLVTIVASLVSNFGQARPSAGASPEPPMARAPDRPTPDT